MSATMGPFWDNEVEHYLYRCYDAGDRLLYIGCTHDVEARMQVHGSSWSNPVSAYLNMRMVRYEAQEPPFKGRIAGRAAEKEAIAAEAPPLNRNHNKGRGLVGAALEAELERTRVPLDPELRDQFTQILAKFGAAS